MKSTTIRAGGALVIAAMTAACVKTGVTTGPDEPRKVEPTTSAEACAPFVQAGTKVTLTMQDLVGTETSEPGQVFRATVDSDLASPGGEVIVPKGSIVRGHVARVHRGGTPLLALDFDTIQTPSGEAPLQAKVSRAETVKSKGLAQVADPYLTSSGTLMYPTDVVVYPKGPTPTPLPYAYYYVTTQEISVQPGAGLTIQLTRAIMPPRTS